MKEKIEVLKKSLRTNITMTKAMVLLGHKELAKRYLENAKEDKQLLTILNNIENMDKTTSYRTI